MRVAVEWLILPVMSAWIGIFQPIRCTSKRLENRDSIPGAGLPRSGRDGWDTDRVVRAYFSQPLPDMRRPAANPRRQGQDPEPGS